MGNITGMKKLTQSFTSNPKVFSINKGKALIQGQTKYAVHGVSDLSVDTYLTGYESNRRLIRVTMACLLAAHAKISFWEAYRNALIQEKKQLLGLLQRQFRELKRLRTPPDILKEKAEDARIVEAAVKRMKTRPASRVATDLKRDLQKGMDLNAVDLSVRFVDQLAVYNRLCKGLGRAKVKRMLAE